MTQMTRVPPDPSAPVLTIASPVMAAWVAGRTALVEELKALGRATGTIKIRDFWIGHFADAMLEQGLAPWDIGTGHPFVDRRRIQKWMAQHTWSAETRRSVQASIRGFYNVAVEDGFTAVNPALRLGVINLPQPEPNPAPDDVVQAAMHGAELRDWMLIGLMRGCGLRREEAARARREHLLRRGRGQDATWWLRVRGKGGREREVPVPPALARVILQQSPGWLFPSSATGHHLTKDYVGKLVRRRMPGPWTPHKLRHAAGSAWGDEGLDIDEIAQLLGHASTDTTRRYVKRRSRRAVVAVHAAAEQFAQ